MLSTSLGFFELPNTISSVEQAHEVMQDGHEFRTILNGLFDEAGVRLQAIEPCDFRMLTSNKEVKNFSEINGLKIRVMDSEIPMSYWAQWGANPTPLAWSEVYMSLQQGMVDAQENPYDSILGSNLQEVQKYVIDTRHVMFYTAFMMNKAFYDARTDAMKAIIDAAAEDAAAYAYADALDSSASNRQKLEDAGMTFIEFTQDDWDKMRANATEADEKVKNAIGEDLFNKMMAALGF
jgi:TRAP-type C4-dicarboxylate transport system substrate-binding protein